MCLSHIVSILSRIVSMCLPGIVSMCLPGIIGLCLSDRSRFIFSMYSIINDNQFGFQNGLNMLTQNTK